MGGRFTPKCYSHVHNKAQLEFPKLASFIIKKSNPRRWPTEAVSRLKNCAPSEDQKLISSICQACVAYVNKHHPAQTTTSSSNVDLTQDKDECKSTKRAAETSKGTASPSLKRVAKFEAKAAPSSSSMAESEDQLIAVDDILLTISSGKVCNADICKIAEAIGKIESKNIKRYAAVNLPQDRREILSDMSYESQWESNGCEIFKSFISGIVQVQGVSTERSSRCIRYLQKSLECLCSARNKNFISPLAHRENMVLHTVSGSKLACEIFAHTQPGGSYSSVLKTFHELGKFPPILPTDDYYFAIDNQQVIGKEYRITLHGGQRTSTVTSISAFAQQNSSKIQHLLEVPVALDFPLKNASELKEKLNNAIVSYNTTHRKYRSAFIQKRLDWVLNEVKEFGGSLDNLDMQSGINSAKYEVGIEYDNVSKGDITVSVFNQKNLLLNPNSYQRVTGVLDSLTKLASESDPGRKWFVLHCDGLPFTIAHKLIRNTYACCCCEATGTKDDLEGKICKNLAGEHDIKRKYSKIVLRPGAGHFEINIVRSIFKTFFNIFIKPVAIMSNYNTPKALKLAMSAVDHHKSWQMLKTLYLGLGDELITFFVTKSDPELPKTLENMSMWIKAMNNKNFSLAFDFVFTILHSLFMFRSGIRQTNDDVSSAGLFKAIAICYASNHPRYQYIYAQDLMYLLHLPVVASDFIRRNSLRVEGSNMGQGVDMLLEEQNKEQKHFLICHGVPTDAQWEYTSANLSLLQKIKVTVLKDLGLTLEDVKARRVNLGKEYIETRIYFRKKLNEASPNTLRTFCEPSEDLDDSFLNFCRTGESNLLPYLNASVSDSKCNLEYVFPSPISSLTTKELRDRIASTIKKLPQDLKNYYGEKLAKTGDDNLDDLYCNVNEDFSDYIKTFYTNL